MKFIKWIKNFFTAEDRITAQIQVDRDLCLLTEARVKDLETDLFKLAELVEQTVLQLEELSDRVDELHDNDRAAIVNINRSANDFVKRVEARLTTLEGKKPKRKGVRGL
jgi:hypothetical protein